VDKGDSDLLRYLLGAFRPSPEMEELEKRLFTDDATFDRLLRLEDALIDAYVHGDLKPRERRLFEAFFLASNRRRVKWELRRGAVASPLRGSSSFFRPRALGRWGSPGRPVWAAVLGACVLLAAYLGFAMSSIHRAERETLDLRERVASIERRSVAAMPAIFLLTPGRVRSGGASTDVLPGADGVILRLELPSDERGSELFDAALSTAEGEMLWQQRRLKRSPGNAVDVRLSGSLLAPADYILSVCAEGPGGQCRALPSYIFRVPKGD
jgi:hypothetical protein